MRPPSIVKFERVVLLSIVLGIIVAFITWDQLSADVAATGLSTGAVIITRQ